MFEEFAMEIEDPIPDCYELDFDDLMDTETFEDSDSTSLSSSNYVLNHEIPNSEYPKSFSLPNDVIIPKMKIEPPSENNEIHHKFGNIATLLIKPARRPIEEYVTDYMPKNLFCQPYKYDFLIRFPSLLLETHDCELEIHLVDATTEDPIDDRYFGKGNLILVEKVDKKNYDEYKMLVEMHYRISFLLCSFKYNRKPFKLSFNLIHQVVASKFQQQFKKEGIIKLSTSTKKAERQLTPIYLTSEFMTYARKTKDYDGDLWTTPDSTMTTTSKTISPTATSNSNPTIPSANYHYYSMSLIQRSINNNSNNNNSKRNSQNNSNLDRSTVMVNPITTLAVDHKESPVNDIPLVTETTDDSAFLQRYPNVTLLEKGIIIDDSLPFTFTTTMKKNKRKGHQIVSDLMQLQTLQDYVASPSKSPMDLFVDGRLDRIFNGQ